jgi:hypothetical protein
LLLLSVSRKLIDKLIHKVTEPTVNSYFIIGGVGERLKPPVLKTGVHFVDREFESRPLRQHTAAKKPEADRSAASSRQIVPFLRFPL